MAGRSHSTRAGRDWLPIQVPGCFPFWKHWTHPFSDDWDTTLYFFSLYCAPVSVSNAMSRIGYETVTSLVHPTRAVNTVTKPLSRRCIAAMVTNHLSFQFLTIVNISQKECHLLHQPCIKHPLWAPKLFKGETKKLSQRIFETSITHPTEAVTLLPTITPLTPHSAQAHHYVCCPPERTPPLSCRCASNNWFPHHCR